MLDNLLEKPPSRDNKSQNFGEYDNTRRCWGNRCRQVRGWDDEQMSSNCTQKLRIFPPKISSHKNGGNYEQQ